MLLAQVEGFLEVARRGNVSRAAEAMFAAIKKRYAKKPDALAARTR